MLECALSLNREVMNCVIVPGKHVALPFVLLYLVLLFCCHISCGFLSVTRREQDRFSFSGVWTPCHEYCRTKNSYYFSESTGICKCECSGTKRTFIVAELKCIEGRDIRNTSKWNGGATLIKICDRFSLILSG